MAVCPDPLEDVTEEQCLPAGLRARVFHVIDFPTSISINRKFHLVGNVHVWGYQPHSQLEGPDLFVCGRWWTDNLFFNVFFPLHPGIGLTTLVCRGMTNNRSLQTCVGFITTRFSCCQALQVELQMFKFWETAPTWSAIIFFPLHSTTCHSCCFHQMITGNVKLMHRSAARAPCRRTTRLHTHVIPYCALGWGSSSTQYLY